MTEEQTNLLKAFIEYERLRGIKNLKVIKAHIKPFFNYLDDAGSLYSEIGFKGAQEFQTHLSTLENKDGSLHYASYTIATIMSYVTRFYNYLKQKGRVYTNPFTGIKKIKVDKKLPGNIPREDKLNRMLDQLSRFWQHEFVRERRIYYKIHVIAELMYATGMRIAEVLNLKRQDIDLNLKQIIVSKGKGEKQRLVYLNDYAAEVLRIYINEMREVINVNKDRDKIFGVKDMSGFVNTVNKYLKNTARKCKIGRFTSHCFRHTLGFHLLRRGCDMRYIQLILGHEDMDTTTIYTKVEKSDLKNELDTYHPRKFKKAI